MRSAIIPANEYFHRAKFYRFHYSPVAGFSGEGLPGGNVAGLCMRTQGSSGKRRCGEMGCEAAA